MIKFFRRIRQRLLAENKFSKYLLYAVGEILLVVIGILIALSINNWNELQKAQEWEKRFLKDLRNELNSDLEQIASVYDMQMAKGDACRKVLEIIKTTPKEDKWIIDSVYAFLQSSNTTFFPTTGVYNSAASSGKIENISNDSLKYAILNLYNRYYNRLVYNGEVLDGVVGRVDWENRKYFSESEKVINSWESIQDEEFKAHLDYLVAQNNLYTSISKECFEKMETVIKMISKEIE